MRRGHAFKVIDSHTGGNPTRIVFSGVPPLPGDSIMAKMQYFRAHHDWIRTALTLEPRGGNLTSSAVLVPPCDPRADIGVFFMEPHGYLPMCGSDTIGLVTTLIETGQIPITGESTVVRLDTPAGLIEATARTRGGDVEDVTFVNVPAFVAALDARIDVGEFGTVTVDVAYGGNFYVIADARQFGLPLDARHTAPAIEVARQLVAATNANIVARHPVTPEIEGVTHVQLFDTTDNTRADARIMVIIPPGIVDRSPCGTGTTAKVATMLAKGTLQPGEKFTHESITGETFTARALEQTEIVAQTAYRVSITGRAYVTADATLLVDPRDPLGQGFLVS